MRNALHGIFLVVVLLCGTTRLRAQHVLAPPPPAFAPQTNLIATLSGTNQSETVTTEAVPSGATASHRLWDLGPVHLHPHIFYSLSYGNGLQSQPGNQSKTLINTISPGIAADIGAHWHLDYTPTLRYYSSREFKDSLDHAVSLTWRTLYHDWTLGASQSYVSSSEPLIETASQTDTETYSTSLSTAYQLNSKISLTFAAAQDFRYVNSVSTNQPLSDSKTWTASASANYQLWPTLSFGPNLSFIYDAVTIGSDMTSEQLQGQVTWRPGSKFTFSFLGGFEVRQFLDSAEPNLLTPVFNLTVAYQPFETTSLSLNASRTVTPSYLESQLTEIYGFTAGIHQRLLGRLLLDLTGGYSTTMYRTTNAGTSGNRQDDRANINVRLSCPFLQRASASIFYDWTDNISNANGFGYTSDQVGLELGYRF